MPEYRLTTETGDVVEATTLEHDREATAWRAAHPFEAPSTGEGDTRQLHLERLDGSDWVRLPGLGTAEAT